MSFSVQESVVTTVGDQVFQRYDTNRNGVVPISMLSRMIEEFCIIAGVPQPNPADADLHMRIFDPQAQGFLTSFNFKNGIRTLGGLPQVAPPPVVVPQVVQQPSNVVVVQQPYGYGGYGGYGYRGYGYSPGLLGLGLGLGLGSGFGGGWGGHHHSGFGHFGGGHFGGGHFGGGHFGGHHH